MRVKYFLKILVLVFSSAYVSNLAGLLQAEETTYNNMLFIRALLINKANQKDLYSKDINKDNLLDLYGYGKINEENLLKSNESEVTLYSNGSIGNNKNHFYELPLPNEFFDFKGEKEIVITLSYFSDVKNTRKDYIASRLGYKFVRKESLDDVIKMFDKETSQENYENIKEIETNRNITSKKRKQGSIQSSSWIFKKKIKKQEKYFIVITRNDHDWVNIVKNLPYSLVITIVKQPSNEDSFPINLYELIKNKIQIREQEQERIKV